MQEILIPTIAYPQGHYEGRIASVIQRRGPYAPTITIPSHPLPVSPTPCTARILYPFFADITRSPHQRPKSCLLHRPLNLPYRFLLIKATITYLEMRHQYSLPELAGGTVGCGDEIGTGF